MAAGPDIVARLQLRADQFSSEGGRAFADMATRARSTSAEVRQTFGTDLAAIGKMAQQALNVPRTKTGSLDLSGEIAALKQSAAAADQRATAAIELRNAIQATAFATNAATEAALRDADAAMVDARAAGQQADSYRQRIGQLELYQAELNKSASATIRHANDNVAGDERARQSKIMLGQQLQDFSVQVSSGQSVVTAFSQQIGQAAFALQGMGGRLAGVAMALTTGWGIAATVALTAIGPLVAKILEGNDALAEAVEKLKDEAAQSEITRQARDLFGRTEVGVAEAIRDSYEASKKAVAAQRDSASQSIADARANLATATTIREKTDAELAWAQALLESAKARSIQGGERGEVATAAVQRYEEQLDAIQKRRLDNSIAIGQAEATINDALIAQERAQAKLMQDPVARVTAEWDAKIAALDDEARRQGKITDEYRKRSRELERQKKLAVEAEQERQSAARRKPARDADAATPASVAALLRRELKGVQITATTNGKHVAGSDHYKSAAIDFVPKGGMASMTKADVRALFERAGIPIRRNAAGVEQLFGPGDKGHSDHFHVAWTKGKLALDNYRASQKDAAAATRDLKREQDELERSLDAILKALDPLAAATARYTERLSDLAKLQASGKITLDQQLDYGRDAQKVFAEDKSKLDNDRFREIFGAEEVDAISREWEDSVQRATADWGDGLREGAERAADVLRDGAGEIASMLGIRMRGPTGRMLNGGVGGFSTKQANDWSERLTKTGIKISPESVSKIGSVLGNAGIGAGAGSVFASITGGKKSALGATLGGALGGEAGKAIGPALASAVGGTLGKTLGSAAGPLGAIAGGIIGNVVGGLFKKTKQGSSTITFGSDGLAAGTATGNGTAEKAAASASANSVVGSLNRIAEALGGSVTGAGSVSIGYRPGHKDGAYRVDTTGSGRLTGVLAFATEEEAIRAAIADALKDGVIGGISDASKRILAAGGDLEKAITKAALIEAVPRDLKAMVDPLGAAIDDLNRKFQKTVDALKEGGATADQMADAQKLYDLQLEQVKSSTAAAATGLKDFLKSLQIGSASPLSARDREAAALADLSTYLTKIDAGAAIDQGKYQDAAKTYLDIERELYGSTAKFFEAFDAVQASTAKAIATIDNASPIGGNASVASPFAKETAASAAATAAGVLTGNEILSQVSDTLINVQQLLGQIAAGGGGGGDFIGAGRLFTNIVAA